MNNEIQIFKPLSESEAIIKNSESFVGMGLWNIGNELKYIRDNKTYEEKGYFSFEEYANEELDYSRSHTYNFISIADKYNVQAIGQIGHLGITKLIALGQLEESERTNFIESNDVDDMTTRELQQAVKRNKELEETINQYEYQQELLREENQRLKNQKPKTIETVIEKEIVPDDYDRLKKEVIDKQYAIGKLEIEKKSLEQKAELNKKNAENYTKLTEQINSLSKQKNDLGRRLNAATELSGLTVEVRDFFNAKFAPIKYSRAIQETSDSEVVKRNLKEILDIFQNWIDEMRNYVTNDEIEIIEAEVIE